MTPAEIATYCKRVTNKENDDFFSNAEIIENYLYNACLQVSELVPCLQTTTDSVSVADQQTYSLAANAVGVKRVEYDGQKLQRITQRAHDAMEYNDNLVQATGDPDYYWIWGNTLYLYTVPDNAGDTIRVYTYDRHAAIAETDTSISIPAQWHTRLCNSIVADMFFKDSDQRGQVYLQRWEQTDKPSITMEWRNSQRRDRFNLVENADQYADSDWGMM